MIVASNVGTVNRKAPKEGVERQSRKSSNRKEMAGQEVSRDGR